MDARSKKGPRLVAEARSRPHPETPLRRGPSPTMTRLIPSVALKQLRGFPSPPRGARRRERAEDPRLTNLDGEGGRPRVRRAPPAHPGSARPIGERFGGAENEARLAERQSARPTSLAARARRPCRGAARRTASRQRMPGSADGKPVRVNDVGTIAQLSGRRVRTTRGTAVSREPAMGDACRFPTIPAP